MILIVDPKRKHKKDGQPCEYCGHPIVENHDNFECKICKYADYDNPRFPRTGVYVRAMYKGVWGSYDIAELDDESLASWVGGLNDEAKFKLIQLLLGRK